jgi:cytoskeletal protein CcmA (bactofilin family)
MSGDPDRLYKLIPIVYRVRDADQGFPLQGLLRVITEQVNLVEDDIAQLYENWFIETCQDWVVPYIGGLIGYQPVYTTGQPGSSSTARRQARERIAIPRREVANTIRYRRRKGTLAILEDLAAAVAGWPARAVEFYRLLSVAQNVNYLHSNRGRTAELRDGDALDLLHSAFDEMARTVDVRRLNSIYSVGRGNIPEVGVFVWRLKAYSVTETPAYHYEEESPNCYLFNPLGHDTALFTHPAYDPGHTPDELKLPVPIRRRAFLTQETGETSGKTVSGVPFYYGKGKSLQILTGVSRKPIAARDIVPADLSGWTYRPTGQQIAVDPELGRIMVGPQVDRRHGVWVSYYNGFSTDLGGGEYDRPLSQSPDSKVYLVGEGNQMHLSINDALAKWQSDQPQHAVIEITDSRVYVEQIKVSLNKKQSLQLRAANRRRPVIRLLDWQTSLSNNLSVEGNAESWFTLDGVLVTGRGLQIEGDVSGVVIRHSTLVPGWGLHCSCEPRQPAEASLELFDAPRCVKIQHSIVGAIRVQRDEVREDPLRIYINDSIVDATNPERIALGAPGKLCAYTVLNVQRTTVFGQIQTHELELAENSILMGQIIACRRQQGCVRFCYVAPGSRTPRRYECQPDLVEKAVLDLFTKKRITTAERNALLQSERLRVEPQFNSARYGRAVYCQLADACAPEISAGADEESEMGVFHDLYQPQRAANLRARLNEYTPAGSNVGIIYAN